MEAPDQLRRAAAAQRDGCFDEAAAICEHVLEREPEDAAALLQLARLEGARGRHSAAAPCFARLVALQPGHAETRHDYAVTLAELGQLDVALEQMHEAHRLLPRSAEILHNLGSLQERLGRTKEAISSYRKAAALAPGVARLHLDLAGALRFAKKLDEAIAEFRIAATLDPNLHEAWAALGAALLSAGQARGAQGALRRAIELRPEDDESGRRLAEALRAVRKFAEAAALYEQIVHREPRDAAAWYGLGCTQLEWGQTAVASHAFERCLSIDPMHAQALHEQGKALFELGCVEKAMPLLRRAAEIGSEEVQALAWQNLAVMVPGSPADDNRTVLETRRTWGGRLAHRPVRRRARRASGLLRIGYVSSFFHQANWMKPVWSLIKHHDRSRFALHLFSDAESDPAGIDYRPDPHVCFHVLNGQSNQQVAACIAEQQIDILVDLNGFSAPRRMTLYPMRPAPILVGWFNMYATTGLDCFDYLIGDEHVIPPREEACYVERILRVPHSYLTFEVDYPVPDVTPPPALGAGQLTIGCLASQYKITDGVVETWSGMLHGSPGARLLIRNAALGRPAHQQHLRDRFSAWGISGERLLLEGPATHYEFLETYGRIDFALDPFPYSGGTTTTEALWQGVPVVTFDGDRWASRTSVSLLREAGLDEFVAPSRQEYAQLCLRLATSADTPARLQALRAGMRERLRSSPICDTKSFARSMEGLYVEMQERGGSSGRG